MEEYTAIFERGEDGWWVASCLGMPEAITQGETIEEASENLRDAIQLLLEIRREDAEKQLEGREVIREPTHGDRQHHGTQDLRATRYTSAAVGCSVADLIFTSH